MTFRAFPLANLFAAVSFICAFSGSVSGQSAWPQYPNNSAIAITSSANVGIGTTNSLRPLHISHPSWTEMLLEDSSLSLTTMGRNWGFLANGGNLAIRYGDGNYTYAPTLLNLTPNGQVLIGILNTNQTLYTLTVNGTIGAKEIVVTNGISADYVFKPGYRLRPLSEVRDFIAKYGHLPEIPSEAEVKEKGVSLNEMQAKLLAKVEELTLHMIQQEKENQDLRQRIATLESRAPESGTSTARGR